jgi:hypothetical protein
MTPADVRLRVARLDVTENMFEHAEGSMRLYQDLVRAIAAGVCESPRECAQACATVEICSGDQTDKARLQ